MIRAAKFTDIPAITALMVAGYERSKYREIDTIDIKEAKSLLMNAIQRHGLKREGGTCVYVIDRDGMVMGFCMGMLERVYWVGTRLKARDVFTYADPKAHGWEVIQLLGGYLRWAKSIPNLALVGFDPHDILGPTERIAKFFRLFGFEECGIMMEMRS